MLLVLQGLDRRAWPHPMDVVYELRVRGPAGVMAFSREALGRVPGVHEVALD